MNAENPIAPAPRLAHRLLTQRLIALVIGIVGALLFIALELPLPWMLGSLFFCLVASISGVPVAGPGFLADLMRTVFGVAIGASFTPELLDRMGGMVLSLALLVPYLAAIAGLGYPFFRRICRFDKPTAYYSAMPGGLQDMTAFGAAAGADIRMLSLVHATRVLVIVSVLPFILEHTYAMEIGGRPMPGTGLLESDPTQMLIHLFCAGFGWWAAKRINIPGATIIGPMVLTALLSLAGVVTARPPVELIILAQLAIGISLGVKYSGAGARLLGHSMLAAVGYCILLSGLAALFTWIDIALGLAPATDALLAFSPGGQAEMTVIAIVVQADVAFIATHHIIRVFLVVLGAPLAHRYFR